MNVKYGEFNKLTQSFQGLVKEVLFALSLVVHLGYIIQI